MRIPLVRAASFLLLLTYTSNRKTGSSPALVLGFLHPPRQGNSGGRGTLSWSSSALSLRRFSCCFGIREQHQQQQQLLGFRRRSTSTGWAPSTVPLLMAEGAEEPADDDGVELEAEKEKKKKDKAAVVNLVQDDEWMGISMELSELVRTAVIQDLKKNAREFLGKDEYKVGDISKEIDSRVKEGVARLRGKEEYELGDFVLYMDEMSKEMTEDLTGKPYEPGDLSIELDKRIKASVAKFCGKDSYEFGDLTKEVSKRVKDRVEEFTGRPYEFGDISRTVNEKRKHWVQDFLGKEAAENYEFGDLTKKAISKWTGKDEYKFGDVTKKVLGNLFGPRKRGGGDGGKSGE